MCLPSNVSSQSMFVLTCVHVIHSNHIVFLSFMSLWSCCPIIHPFDKGFIPSLSSSLCAVWHPLSVLMYCGHEYVFYLLCLLWVLFKSFSWFLLKYSRQQALTGKTHLIFSCSEGKPSEEPPKGRGRGFGGENILTLELMCANSFGARWCLRQFHSLHSQLLLSVHCCLVPSFPTKSFFCVEPLILAQKICDNQQGVLTNL